MKGGEGLKRVTKGTRAYIIRIRGGKPEVRTVQVVSVGERRATIEDIESGERTTISPLCLYGSLADAEIAMRKITSI